ncbi:pyridoxamine 5'-phosphate oxidase family protein [Enterococcus nangangensis]|uniref:pyridoxamine 5'-phosphate oxidase family protein n=1 Tax=Enterococcus nangangensis TaxID=2559926 RepID=UPI0010F7E27F|nr:pyridoxamine 5'-phosphate oxidase family protein [Enterococcus nangangensis]
MLNPTFLEVLKHEGVVTIISSTAQGFHAVNTWNSYMRAKDQQLYIPAAGMHSVEKDVAENPEVLITIGSKEVPGLMGPGTGFHVHGTAHFVTEGPVFEQMFADYPFISRVLVVDVTKMEQKI